MTYRCIAAAKQKMLIPKTTRQNLLFTKFDLLNILAIERRVNEKIVLPDLDLLFEGHFFKNCNISEKVRASACVGVVVDVYICH